MGSAFVLPFLLQSHKPLCPVEVVFELQQQGAKASGKGRGGVSVAADVR